MSKYGIEDAHFMLMDLYAMQFTLDRRPKSDRTPLGLLITDDDRRLGIRKFFAPEPITDEQVDMVLEELKEHFEIQMQVMRIADAVVGSMGFRI
jgi:hypothetical protein